MVYLPHHGVSFISWYIFYIMVYFPHSHGVSRCTMAVLQTTVLAIAVSLSKHHIVHDNRPVCRIMVCMCVFVCMHVSIYLSIYLSMYLCIIYTAFTAPWFLRFVYIIKCSVYSNIIIDMLTCVITHRLNSKDNWSLELVVVCHKDYQWRQVGECADTWYINRFSLLRVELLLPRTCQRACVNQKQRMGWLYCCFVMFISAKAWHWTCTVPGCCLWMWLCLCGSN